MADGVRWLDDAERAAWTGYRQMKRALDARVASELTADSGLSEPDYDVLSLLNDSAAPRWCIKDLGTRLLWSPSRTSHHLARMASRGLIDRFPCETDARGTDISLTATGRRAIETAAPAHVESVRRHFIDQLTPTDLADLARITSKVTAHLRSLGQQ
ncbi:transcriptional regulator, MarR family [Micromonospora rhizosphaerae]|uniref:Transcriptional regulator, MarR family n=1 Tax=Micromonospora rhizosphaerae TaxID=568872 RepID=A0A1C6T415_9ACTN|nr:MarR family transcriptional regulator [Micromonospora rhizosphaerae]SCL36534.1 transcriptional regulator, MarR family [Micromonospora rhizosphaerae]